MSLELMAKQAQILAAEAQKNPLAFFRPTPPQEAWLRDKSKMKLLRGANQVGKTACGSVETVWRVLGCHPYFPTTKPPIEAWIIAHSWEQSKIVQAKLHSYIPPAELHPDMEFVPGRGYRGTGAPCIRFRNGSIIRVKTTQQAGGSRGTLGLASGSVNWIWIDEPPSPSVWSELAARILRTRGSIGITMTPVGVPVDFLKKMVESGMVTDHPAPLTVENCTPRGCRPLLSSEEIQRMADSYLSFDRACRMEGSWEGFIPDGVIFEHFRDEQISDVPCPAGEYKFSIGIDHGSDAGSQFAVLIASSFTPGSREPPYVYVLDEYSSGAATAEIHARGILAMISRNQLQVRDISRWTGDRSHAGDRYGGRMSNSMLRSAFEHVLKYPRSRLPFKIHTAFKPRFSVYYGCQVINEIQAKGRFQVHPRCKKMIKSLKNWALLKTGRMDSNSDHKHGVDALRYALMPVVDYQYRAPRLSKIAMR